MISSIVRTTMTLVTLVAAVAVMAEGAPAP